MELFYSVIILIVYLLLMIVAEHKITNNAKVIVYVCFAILAYVKSGVISILLFAPVLVMGYVVVVFLEYKQKHSHNG